MKIKRLDKDRYKLTCADGTETEVTKELMEFVRRVNTEARDVVNTRGLAVAMGKSRQWVNRMAARHNVGKLVGKERLYWREDVQWLKENSREPGRPKKGDKVTPPPEHHTLPQVEEPKPKPKRKLKLKLKL